MSNSLYVLTNDFLEVMARLDEMELDEETKQDTLESLKMPLEEKAENIIKYVRNLEALADARKAEAKRLSESASSDLIKANNLLKYLDENLTRAGIKQLQAGVFEVKYRKGSEVVEVDEIELPSEYWVEQEPKPMGKTELKKRLKAGEVIPGVSLVRKPDSLLVK